MADNPLLTIIDDNIGITNLLSDVASDLDYDIRIYNSGAVFIEEGDYTSSVIILDLVMPDADGIEIIRALAKRESPAKIIIISGRDKSVLHSAQQLAQECNLAIVDSLTKPISVIKLRGLLSGLLEDLQSSQELQLVKPSIKKSLSSDVSEVVALRSAIRNNELILHFQPQISMLTGSLLGVEALVRWQHPRLGLLNPDLFIPLAEKSGLIHDLTVEVIKQSIQQRKTWHLEGLPLQISINISAENIVNLNLPEQLKELVNHSGLEPSFFVLELTENALLKNAITSLDILTRLRLKGFNLSIDDFGTGYSSLSQLHRVAFTELKIDKSFVMQMNRDEDALAIIETCIMLGHKLNMHVTAEGVETKANYEALKKMGCDNAQGFYIAKPMPATSISSWVGQHQNKDELVVG